MILSALLNHHGTSLNDESKITLLADIKSIINSRPLTVETFSDIGSKDPFSAINILTIKFIVVLPPPADFKQPDLHISMEKISILLGSLMSLVRGVFKKSSKGSQMAEEKDNFQN